LLAVAEESVEIERIKICILYCLDGHGVILISPQLTDFPFRGFHVGFPGRLQLRLPPELPYDIYVQYHTTTALLQLTTIKIKKKKTIPLLLLFFPTTMIITSAYKGLPDILSNGLNLQTLFAWSTFSLSVVIICRLSKRKTNNYNTVLLRKISAQFQIEAGKFTSQQDCIFAAGECQRWLLQNFSITSTRKTVYLTSTKYAFQQPTVNNQCSRAYIYTEECILEPVADFGNDLQWIQGVQHEVCSVIIDSHEYLIDWSCRQFRGLNRATVTAFAK